MKVIPFFLAAYISITPAFAYSDAEFLIDNQYSQDIYRSGDLPGALVQAQAVYNKAIAAFGPAGANSLEAGITLSNMMIEVGDSAGAVAFLEKLDATATAAFLQFTPIRIKISVAYANSLVATGQAEKALPLQIDAAAAAEASLGPDHDTTLIFYFNLAKTYEILGYGDQALATYRHIADIYSRADTADTLMQRANVHTQIARTLYQMAKYQDAVDAYRIALPMLAGYWGPGHPRTLSQELVFGYALWQTGQHVEVAALLDDLLVRANATYGPDSVFHGDIYELRALTISNGGPKNPQFAQALSLMAKSIQIKSAQLDPTHRDLGKPMLEYAAMLRDAQDFAQAATFALKAEKAGFASRDLLIDTLVSAANAGQMTDQEAAAELFRIVQQSSNSKAGFASLQLAARFALNDSKDADRFRQITDSAQRQSVLEAQLLDASMRPLAERDKGQEADLRQQIANNASIRNQSETALYVNQPNVADLIGGGVLSVQDVQSLLGSDGALVVVDFGDFDNSPGFAISVTEAGVGFDILPYSARDYAAAVADIRAGISLKLGTRSAVPLDDLAPLPRQDFDFVAADWLYQASIGRVFAINGKRKHLYLDLRGPMAAIPPHLLITQQIDTSVTEQTASWLVRDFAITVLPSVYSLKLAGLAKASERPTAPLLGFANPIYTETGADLTRSAGQTLRGSLTPLPETETELLQIAKAVHARADEQHLGLMASEAELKKMPLTDYSILYFATHGLVSGDMVGDAVLGEPALALTGGQGEDGLLTATEISRLALNADLVVLSACNTAVGDKPGAQALSGLARSFTYAGARSLMVSHWPVESQSAVQMMTDIFNHRAADPGLTAAEAQRKAILSMIEKPQNPAWSHPAFWAPFVLVGDPG